MDQSHETQSVHAKVLYKLNLSSSKSSTKIQMNLDIYIYIDHIISYNFLSELDRSTHTIPTALCQKLPINGHHQPIIDQCKSTTMSGSVLEWQNIFVFGTIQVK